MQINRANDYQLETQFVKEGDYNGRELVVQITNAGEVSDQTGVSLNFGWRHDSVGNTGLDPFTIVDASKGIFKITYPTEMLIAGDVTASIQILEGVKITLTRNFKITVERNPVNEDAIVSENSFTVLQEALKTVNQYDSRIANVEDGIGNVEAYIENVKTVNVLDFGVVGDGVVDDTASIQSLINTLNDGDTIVFPEGAYRTTDTITIKKSITIKMQGYILADHANIGVLFKNGDAQGNFSSRNTPKKSTLNVDIDIFRPRNKGYETQPTAIGVEMWNVYYGTFNVKRLENNNVGLKLVGEKYGTSYAGMSYCKYILGIITSYSTNILMVANGSEGYVTQNQFYSGSLSGGEREGTVHVSMINNGTSVINENVFFGTSFEGSFYTAVKGRKAWSNKLISCRFEMPKIKYLFDFEGCRFNQFLNCYSVDSPMRGMKYNNNSSDPNAANKDNYLNFIDYRLGYVEFFDDIFYIKPLNNKDGVFGTSNGIKTDMIPSGWRVEVIKSGLSDTFTYVNSASSDGVTVNLPIAFNDKINISEDRTNFPISKVTLNTPPKHSKEGYLFFRSPTKVALSLEVSSEINGVIDKTGNNSSIPVDSRLVKYLYEYFSNTIYILDILN